MPTPTGRRFLDAAAKPLHLLPPGVGMVAAGGLLVAGLPPLAVAVGVLSMGAWGALVAWDLVGPGPAPAPEPPPVDPLAGIRTERLRLVMGAIHEAARRVERQIDGHEGAVTPSLLELSAESRALVTAADEAARRADALAVLLASVDHGALARELDERARAAAQAPDPEVARALRLAADAKGRERETWRELGRLVDRITAELVAAEASLDELAARVIRVTHDDPADTSAGGAEVRGQVKAVADRLQVLEKSAADTLREVG